MNVRDYLSDDGLALLALGSQFALPEAADVAPLTLSEWNQLERHIEGASLAGPAALQGLSAAGLAKALAVGQDNAERIAALLERSARLALALEDLFSRGLWVVTRLDEWYPAKLRDTLKHQAPTVLFGAGEIQLLRQSGIAVIGSRNIDEAGTGFAREVGRLAAGARWPVISGGARGTDRLAMDGALQAGGVAFGVLADSLETTVRKTDVREFLLDGRLVLLTPYAPSAGFSVGAAMGRNKVVYGLADYAVVVSSDLQSGGTWAGAVEDLKAGWCLVFVRDGQSVPTGNKKLIELGATPWPEGEFPAAQDLRKWLRDSAPPKLTEQDLFGPA